MAGSFMVGESLVGEGNEVAHIDLVIGSKDGPVGEAFTEALVNQKEGHTNLLAVVAPNLPAKPDTVISNKVTIKGATQAVQMFGPAQAAVARAVVDSVSEGVIDQGQVDDLCILVGVFIHWEATDDKKIFDYNYQATKESIARALAGQPSAAGRSRPVGRGAASVRRRRGGLIATRLAGARAVVTGASSGIGRAIAEAFAGAGADVLAHLPRKRAARAASWRSAPGRRSPRPTSPPTQACEALVEEARERLGGLDVWVNNAGADVLTGEAAGWEWERKLDLLLAVDLKGTIACSFAAGAVMREQPDGGVILNMSWDHVTTGMAGENPLLFSAVKGGVLAFSKSLARELAPRVRVNVLCPGWIETAFAHQADDDFRRRSPSRLRCSAGAGPRTSPPRPSGSPHPRPRSLPDRVSTSTAAS